MPQVQKPVYQWPSSGLTGADMTLLHRARERSPTRTPITELLARAVRAAYGQSSAELPGSSRLEKEKIA